MKRLLNIIFPILLCGYFLPPPTLASHYMAVDMSYECLGGCDYRIYHKAYYDCSSSSTFLPPSLPPSPSNTSLVITGIAAGPWCGSPTAANPRWVLQSYLDITNICPGIPTSCDSATSPIRGVIEAVHYNDYSFCNLYCTQYEVAWQGCCRSGFSSGATRDYLYLSDTIDLSLSSCNSTPQFMSNPFQYMCAATPNIFVQNAFDPDGDSLVFSLAACMQDDTVSITYNTGYTPTQPLGLSWDVSIDSHTGNITFLPTGGGNILSAPICVRVEEYRNGVKIGETTRDMQVLATTCGASATPIVDSTIGIKSARLASPDTLDIWLGDTAHFQVHASDIDIADVLSYTSNISFLLPNAFITQMGTNPCILDVKWPQPDTAYQGTIIYVEIKDNNCPIPRFIREEYYINMIPFAISTTATPSACTQSTGTLTAYVGVGSGNYSYLWSTGATTPTITGLAPGTYWVDVSDSTLGVSVRVYDTIGRTTFNIGDTIVSPDCYGLGGNISLTPSGGIAPYTYLWNTGDTMSTINGVQSTNYIVSVTDSIGCQINSGFLVPPPDSCWMTISGVSYIDFNNNCIQDTNEIGLPNAYIDITPGGAMLTDANGYYEFQVDTGTYSITENPPVGANVSCPSNNMYTIQSSIYGADTTGLDFANTVAGAPDVSVHIRPNGQIRVGRNIAYNITVVNRGNTTITGGTLRWVHDSLLMISNLVGNVGYTYDSSLQTATWTLDTIPPFGFDIYQIYVTPSIWNANIGDTVHSYAKVFPIGIDINPSNNVDTNAIVITGAYDPNDKQVEPKGLGTEGYIQANENLMRYHIRFQNTGNDTAFNVVIRDTIDPDLDITTIRLLGGSHPFNVSIEDDEVVVFTFPNIMLPDSNVDELGSQGFVAFEMNHNGTLAPGDEILNSVAIYFDFNAAVITNTVKNTIFAEPTFTVSPFMTICEADTVNLQAVVTEGVPPYTFAWSNGDTITGDTSGVSTLSIVGATSQTYTVTFIDHLGFTGTENIPVIVDPLPIADFSFNINNATVSFTHNSQYATSYTWDFGDGNTSTGDTISYTYASAGTYTVYLYAHNDCGTDTATYTISISTTSIEDPQFQQAVTLYPNPFTETTLLIFPNPSRVSYNLTIYDMSGKQVRSYRDIRDESICITKKTLPTGIYMYRLSGTHNAYGRLTIR